MTPSRAVRPAATPANPPANEGVIPRIIDEVWDAKSSLHEALIELERRLSPALAPSTPPAPGIGSTTPVEPKNPEFVLRHQLKGIISQLHEMTSEVRNVLDRLEL